MLWAVRSKLWSNGIELLSKSCQLGTKKRLIGLIGEKAIGQFGEQNVEVTREVTTKDYDYFHICSGLINCFGLRSIKTTVLIHWDKVTITNEEDKSTDIRDLFCRLRFENEHLSDMYFSRTTYTQSEWNVRYRHSHLPPMNRSRPLEWDSMCLGNGPIVGTKNRLRDSFSTPSEELFDVFFWELDKLVHVESLRGVPYIGMRTIGTNTMERADSDFNPIYPTPAFKTFMQSFFGAVKIPLGYENGMYVCGCTFMDFAILVTNYWNKYERVFRVVAPIFKTKYILKNSAIYSAQGGTIDYTWQEVRTPYNSLTFKGQTYPLTVTPDTGENASVQWLVNLSIVKYIQRAYLALVNMKFNRNNYGKEEDRQKRNDKELYSFYASSGVCSVSSKYGADTEDSLLLL